MFIIMYNLFQNQHKIINLIQIIFVLGMDEDL